MKEIDQILRDPSATFSDPCEVLCQLRLSRDEKIRVLQQWRYDLVQLQAASAENLTGDSDPGSGIQKIDECLRQLHLENEPA